MKPSLQRSRYLQILLCVFFSATLAAQGQDPAALESRLETLRRELAQIQATLALAPRQPDGSPTSLNDRVDDLSTRIKVLARQIELEKEQAAERNKTLPQPAAGAGGFSLQSADGQFRLRLRGYAQSDGRFFLDDAGQRGADTFVLRRVRPIVEATMYGLFDLRLMPDFGGGTTVLQDAYIDMRLRPQVKIRAGKFKPPLGFERLMSAAEMPFIERALPTSLVPNRDLGVMLHGDLAGGNLNYGIGAFNGVVDGGSADSDTRDGKDAVGRLFLQPFRTRKDSRWQGLGLGVGGSYGTQRGTTAAAAGLPTFRTSSQLAFFSFRGDDPVIGPALADGTHTRISAQGHYYVGSLGLLAEQVRSTQEVRRGTSTATLDFDSWQVAGTWVLTGETPSYRGVAPRTRFDLAANTWGAFELTARHSLLTIDRDAFPLFANPNSASHRARAWAGGLNWYLNNGVKVQANFEHTTYDSLGTTRRRADNDLLTRIQFAF